MKSLGLSRYLTEWLGLVLALAGLGELILRHLGETALRAAVLSGVAVVGAADVAVFVLVGTGLLVRPERFVLLWGISILGKVAWYGLAAAVLILAGLVPQDPFLLALGSVFPVFTAHQVIRLVRLADAQGRRRGSAVSE